MDRDRPDVKNFKDQERPPPGTKSGANDLASKISNPSAPLMSIFNFLDAPKVNGGSAPGARSATFNWTLQPVLPFPTKLGNVIIRPTFTFQFGEPFLTGAGTVDSAVAFGNISLDTVWGATLKNGLIAMGGLSILFPSNSKSELRADWAVGPEAVIGYASPTKGHVVGTIWQFTWSFPTRARGQTVGGQYFYAINIGEGWQIGAQPTWSYSRETKILELPIGLGVQKVVAFGKNNFPMLLGVQVWGYVPPPGELGPDWTLRFTVAPVVKRPWKR